MVNVITPKWKVVEADRLVHLVSNKSREAILAICQTRLTIRVAGVGEFVEIGDVTQEIHKPLNGDEYLNTKCRTQGLGNGFMEVGASHSSLSRGKPCTWRRAVR